MARDPVQFQKGLSLSDFNARYGREEQCHAALIEMRWPEGFVCPNATANTATARRGGFSNAPPVVRAQTSVKAGTIFHHLAHAAHEMVPGHLFFDVSEQERHRRA